MDEPHFPVLYTERLMLRALKKSDWKEILFLRSSPQVNAFIQRPVNRQTNTKAQAFEFIDRINGINNTLEWFYWCINLKGNPKTIGTICLWNFTATSSTAELGYDLHPDFQQKGIMSEALTAVVNFGFTQLNKNQIEAFTHKDNLASIQLLNRHGFIESKSRKDDGNAYNRIFEFKKESFKEVLTHQLKK